MKYPTNEPLYKALSSQDCTVWVDDIAYRYYAMNRRLFRVTPFEHGPEYLRHESIGFIQFNINSEFVEVHADNINLSDFNSFDKLVTSIVKSLLRQAQ